MAAHGMVQSPVLVGRDDLVALAGRRLGEAADGAGQLLLVAGEAGIGKTRLLGVIAQRAQVRKFTVLRAAAFPGDTQSFAGLLLDLAADLTAAREPALNHLGQSLSSRIRAISTLSPAGGDAHHRRRLLIQDLVDLLVTTEPGGPLLILLEDLHWADELSLDVLGHLSGRLATRPMLIAGAYRSDELYPKLPMRELRARLLAQRLAEEIRLTRLKPEQTATMIGAMLGRPSPAALATAVHDRSDGIPLHVEELLAAIDTDEPTPQSGAEVRAVAVPDTLADAVLSRVQGLAARTREVVAAAAVIGRSFDFDLLTAVTEADPAEVAAALRELREAYLVLPGTDAVTFDFRHALIRDTLYADTDLPTRRRLHESVARTAAQRGYRDAFVSAHFEQAQRAERAYHHAIIAAREAAAISPLGRPAPAPLLPGPAGGIGVAPGPTIWRRAVLNAQGHHLEHAGRQAHNRAVLGPGRGLPAQARRLHLPPGVRDGTRQCQTMGPAVSPPAPNVTFWTWKVSTKGPVYIAHANWGQRVSTAVVSESAPTAVVLVFPAAQPINRGALGVVSATSPDWVFTLHAISPNGPDAPGLLTAIQAACGAVPWIAAGDFNRAPAIAGFNCIGTDRHTWKTDDPSKTLDWCATSAPVGKNIGQVSGLYMSDHYPVLFDL